MNRRAARNQLFSTAGHEILMKMGEGSVGLAFIHSKGSDELVLGRQKKNANAEDWAADDLITKVRFSPRKRLKHFWTARMP